MAKKKEGEKPTKKTTPSRNDKGQFVKGREKTGGRKAGTKNKNSNIRDRLKEQIDPFIDEVGEMIVKVQKEEGTAAALLCMSKLMPYFLPKYTSINFSADANRPISEEEHLMELDAKYTKKEISINIKSLTIIDNDNPDAADYDPDDDPDFSLDELK